MAEQTENSATGFETSIATYGAKTPRERAAICPREDWKIKYLNVVSVAEVEEETHQEELMLAMQF